MSAEETLQERFEAFDAAHPQVYEAFKRVARALLARQRRRYGAKAIIEILRYEWIVSGRDEQEPFKLNNIYTSRLVRKLIAEDERFRGFFELRELRTA